MFSPVRMRIILTIAAQRKWRLANIEVKNVFLQTNSAERHVYVLPPREPHDKGR